MPHYPSKSPLPPGSHVPRGNPPPIRVHRLSIRSIRVNALFLAHGQPVETIRLDRLISHLLQQLAGIGGKAEPNAVYQPCIDAVNLLWRDLLLLYRKVIQVDC
jgi:hypothetical protein